MISPVLPKAEGLADFQKGKVDSMLIDQMNYHYGDRVYRDHKLEEAVSDSFFYRKSKQLPFALEKQGNNYRVLF
jgi:hypothetical protein